MELVGCSWVMGGLPGVDEAVHVVVVVPGFTGLVGVSGVDVVILFSPCDRGASAGSEAVGLDGLKGKGWLYG